MSTRWVLMFVLLALIVFVAAAPIISVAIAGWIANAHGCVLHEGYPNPCIVNGADMGETLYAMGVMGWFMLMTIPAGLAAIAVWAIFAMIMLVGGRRRTANPET